MRLLHTSDWHLGIALGNKPLIEEQHFFLEQLYEIVKDKKADGVIVAGDVFDSSISGNDAIALYNDAVTTLCLELQIPVFVIAGNHDGAARLASCNQLLEKTGLYIAGKLKRDIKPVEMNDTAVFLLPYFNIDEARACFPEEEIKSYEDAMKTVCNHLQTLPTKCAKKVLVAHAYVGGATISESDRAAQVGTATVVSKSVFEGFDYVALGHLHRQQKLSEHIYYSGTPIKYSFGEANQQKGVLLYDTESDEVESIPLTPKRDMRILEGEYEELLSQAAESDDYVKIHVTDHYVGLQMVELFRNYYPNLTVITGKSMISEQEENSLSIEEMENLSPMQIVEKFCLEMMDTQLSEDLRSLFEQAFAEVEETE